MDSDAVEDICGICNGDGTQCRIVEEVYKDTGARGKCLVELSCKFYYSLTTQNKMPKWIE